MDTVVPQAPQPDTKNPSVYTWEDADTANPDGAPKGKTAGASKPIVGGPQVSQPAGDMPAPPPNAQDALETPRAATIRRVATGAVGVGLLAAGAVVATKMLRGVNAKAGANVIDYDD